MLRVLAWNGVIYFISMFVFGIPWWKSIIGAAVITISAHFGYGRRWIFRFGVILMFVAMFVWFGALPPPDHWIEALTRLKHDV